MSIEPDAGAITRTFQEISDDKLTEATQAVYLREIGYRNGSTWADLLKSSRVLIISEAGVGKTFECREQQQLLWNEGEPAFYLELADLARSNVREMLSADEEARFDAWLSSQSDTATFFLDSIDELKLTLGSFEQALKRLAKAIAGQLSRVRIIVTSRPIPIDRQLIRQTLPVPPKPVDNATSEEFADIAVGKARKEKKQESEPEPKEWRNVALMPLSDEQIREMAIHEKVSDPDAMMAEIKRRNAEEFARRPQDLIELCADWRDHKRIRTHREQVSSNVAVKLKPRADGKEKVALSFEKALEGASRLALAATFTRKLTLRHSAEADRGTQVPDLPLDPSIILPDWDAPEITTLLERPLFGFASYGRVRFHHRSVIEYLTAQRLATLRARGMTSKALNRILFATTAQGDDVVRPSTVPVAAWLALDDEGIFAEIQRREPSVLLTAGDPESLSPDHRKLALRAFVERYGTGGWRGLRVPSIQVHRFAGEDLGPTIIDLWSTNIENDEVRSLLLGLIEAGKCADCADIAYDVVMDSARADGERLDGLQVLIGLNDARMGAVVASLANNSEKWPFRLTRYAIVRLFPERLSVAQLRKVLEGTTENKRTVGGIAWNLPRIIERADMSGQMLDELRSALTALITDKMSWNKDAWPHTQTERHFLIPALAATCAQMFESGNITDDLLRSSIIALRLFDREYEASDDRKTLRGSLADAPLEHRRSTFLIDDAFMQGLKSEPDAFQRYARLSFSEGIIVPGLRDNEWLLALLADRSRAADERAMFLEAAMRINDQNTVWADHLDGLKAHVADQPALVGMLEQKAQPAEPDLEHEKWKREQAIREKAEKRRLAKAHESWVKFWEEIAANPDAVFADTRSSNTAWNLWTAMERTGEDSQASGWNRRFIERHFGNEVADRLRLAVMKFWRNDHPTLRSERADNDKNSFYTRWQLGLAGIAAEAEDPAWATKLTREDAALALRYAQMELGNFPAWMESFAAAFPDILDDVLGNELMLELAEPPAQHSSMLQNIRYATPTLALLFTTRLRAWLNAGDWHKLASAERGVYRERLNQVLAVILQQPDDATVADMRDFARKELDADPAGPLTLVWLPILFRFDPQAGADALEAMVAPLPPAKFGDAVTWMSSLFSDRLGGGADVPLSAPGVTPELLLRLVRLAYQHVRVADDMNRGEGTHTPNERDNAEDARNNLLSALLAAGGTAGWESKVKMIDDPLFAHFRDRIAAVARERAAEDADAAVFSEQAVLALDAQSELPPLVRDDMFALMVDRLDDLDDVLVRDDSPRSAWALIQDEKIMRRQIARELRGIANKAYTVNQEAVTAEEKETDIRLRSTGSEQEAVIELKIGEKDRSGADLRDGIKTQLLTKYMAPEHRRSGCFLITVASDRSWEHPNTGAKLDLKALIAMLNEEAKKLEQQMAGTVRIVARGLDLRPRLPTELAAKPKTGKK